MVYVVLSMRAGAYPEEVVRLTLRCTAISRVSVDNVTAFRRAGRCVMLLVGVVL